MAYHRFFDAESPLAISHAGDTSTGAVAGSLESYLLAWQKGFRCFQLDVVALANGELISSHAVTGRKRRWESQSVARLRAAGHEISTVDEIVDALPGSRWNLEIKSRFATDALARLIERRPEPATRFLISSPFRPVILRDLNRRFGSDLAIAASLIDGGLIGLPLRPGGMDADAMQLWKFLAKSKWVLHRCEKRDIHVQVWTLNSTDEIDAFLALGVPGIITDNHGVAAGYFSQHFEWPQIHNNAHVSRSDMADSNDEPLG